MRGVCDAYKDHLDNDDRKEIRRIFFQMLGLYMSLGVIAIAGVAGRFDVARGSYGQNIDFD